MTKFWSATGAAWAWAQGRKTIWVARAYVLAGLILYLQPAIEGGFPVLREAFPSPYWPLFLIGTGILFEVLRWITYGPVRPREAGDVQH